MLCMVDSVHAGVTCCNVVSNVESMSGLVFLLFSVTPLTRFAKFTAFYPVLLVWVVGVIFGENGFFKPIQKVYAIILILPSGSIECFVTYW